MGSNICQRGFGDKAQVGRSWCWAIGFRLKLLPNLMQVDFLVSKTQSFTVTLKHTQSWSDRTEYLYFAATMWCCFCVTLYLKSDNLHSQNLGVKMSGFVQVPNSEHQVVQMSNVNWTGTSEPSWWESTEKWLEVKARIIWTLMLEYWNYHLWMWWRYLAEQHKNEYFAILIFFII